MAVVIDRDGETTERAHSKDQWEIRILVLNMLSVKCL